MIGRGKRKNLKEKTEKESKEKNNQETAGQSIDIPSIIFRDRALKVLEVLVEFLKEQKSMNYHDIGLLLNRDERTIWTAYNRAKKKRAKKKDEKIINPRNK